MRYLSLVTAGLIGGTSIGCAHNPPAHASDRLVGVSAATVVTAAELQRVGQGRSVFAALQQARPWLLASRGGGEPVVSIDGSSPTDASALRSISVADVCEVRLLRATSGAGRSAISTNGQVQNGGDIILVLTRSASACPGKA